MTTGVLEGKRVRDPEFLLAIRDQHRAIDWAVDDARARYRDPLLHAYTQKVAQSAYRRALDDAHVRAAYRAYRRVVIQEGSHDAACARILLGAVLGLLAFVGVIVLGALISAL